MVSAAELTDAYDFLIAAVLVGCPLVPYLLGMYKVRSVISEKSVAVVLVILAGSAVLSFFLAGMTIFATS